MYTEQVEYMYEREDFVLSVWEERKVRLNGEHANVHQSHSQNDSGDLRGVAGGGELGCLCGKAGTSHLCDGSAHSSGCVVNALPSLSYIGVFVWCMCVCVCVCCVRRLQWWVECGRRQSLSVDALPHSTLTSCQGPCFLLTKCNATLFNCKNHILAKC